MPGAQPRKDPWVKVSQQLRRQGMGQSSAPGQGKV
jgi:hypothetical protein